MQRAIRRGLSASMGVTSLCRVGNEEVLHPADVLVRQDVATEDRLADPLLESHAHDDGRLPIWRYPAVSRCRFSRRSSCAFAATMMVEALIATAPTLMGRSIPQRTRRPPAIGMATKL
jgi:hypothetical protein